MLASVPTYYGVRVNIKLRASSEHVLIKWRAELAVYLYNLMQVRRIEWWNYVAGNKTARKYGAMNIVSVNVLNATRSGTGDISVSCTVYDQLKPGVPRFRDESISTPNFTTR